MRLALIEILVILVFGGLFLGLFVTLILSLIRALRTYIQSHGRPPAPAEEAAPAPSKTLAQALKDHRTRRRLTQEYVADALGVSRQAVSKWETGESEPTMSNLTALAKVYGVTLSQLLQDVT